MFLRNAWYVAAFERDVLRALVAVRILGESIVLYRTEQGAFVALQNNCPHRKLPLSMGRLIGDTIECGYHGLTFSSDGRCIHAPGMMRIPPAAKVRRYPTVARYGLVWIWMGDEGIADSAKICPVDHWHDPRWGRNQGEALVLDCNYLLVTDNLLDPSHVAWVHRSSFGSADCAEEAVNVEVSDLGVVASRWIKNIEVAPFYRPFVTFVGRCDRLQRYEVRFPCHAIIQAVFVPTGTGGTDSPLDHSAFIMDSYNFITPVDEQHSKYFWFQLRNFAPDNAEMSAQMTASVRAAFEEDRLILNAVEAGLAMTSTANIDLATDRGPTRFRRRLKRLIASEALKFGVTG